MKKSMIQWMRKFSILTGAGVLLAMHAQAQVPITSLRLPGSYGSPTITSSGDACLTYTAGVGDNRVYTFTGLALGTPTYSWSVQGGLAIVGSATGVSVTVKPAAGLNRPYPKGRLSVFYKGTIDSTITITSCPDCNGNQVTTTQIVKIPKSGTVYIDTYQKFDYTDQIVGNVCVSKNDSVAYSIKDLLTGNPNQNIGSDSYIWTYTSLASITGPTPQYVSADSSSVTFKYFADPAVGTTYTMSVTVGRCNVGIAGRTKTKTLAPKVPKAVTSPVPNTTYCLATGTTTLNITNTTKTGITYSWSKTNDNWLYTAGTNSTSQAGISLNVGSQSGTVYLTSTPSGGTYCGTRIDTIIVKRSLTGTSVAAVPAATCFTRGVAYTFQISSSPSTAVIWTVPSGWTVDPNNLNAPTVTITPGPSAVSGTISAVGKDCAGSTNAFTANIAPAQPVVTGTACVTRGGSYAFSTPAITGATSYNWSFPTGWTWTPLNGNSVTATVGSGGLSGNVTVTAVGCSNNTSTAYAVTILPPKPGTVTFTPATCVNKGLADTLTFGVTPVAGVTYQWVLPAGWVAGTNSAPYSSYVVYTNGTAGSYYVKVRGQSTCGGTTNYSAYDSVLVTINGIGTNVFITKSPIDSDGNGVQDGENLTANAVAAPVRYQWYNASGPIVGETTRFLDLLNAGTPNGAYYVRVFKNGCQTQANTTSNYAYRTSGPSATDLMAKVNVFPIPASDEITIDLPISYQEGSIDIVDMAGVNMLTKTLHGKSVNVPLSKFAAGSYYVMFTIDGTTFSKKIVVVK